MTQNAQAVGETIERAEEPGEPAGSSPFSSHHSIAGGTQSLSSSASRDRSATWQWRLEWGELPCRDLADVVVDRGSGLQDPPMKASPPPTSAAMPLMPEMTCGGGPAVHARECG